MCSLDPLGSPLSIHLQYPNIDSFNNVFCFRLSIRRVRLWVYSNIKVAHQISRSLGFLLSLVQINVYKIGPVTTRRSIHAKETHQRTLHFSYNHNKSTFFIFIFRCVHHLQHWISRSPLLSACSIRGRKSTSV